jgi:hypothetical protein
MPARAITDWKPRTLTEYVEVVEELRLGSGGPLWYRGCPARSQELLPSLYRRREFPKAAPVDLSQLEQQLVTRFRDRSLPYHNRDLNDDLETLFFMQHYSIPTRLLDWTENPFVGLFFALRLAGYERNSRGGVSYLNDAAVWVLDPSLWNKAALVRLSYTGGPLDSKHAALGSYKLIGDIGSLSENPVALYGAHNSDRIVVQQGTFVIFGSNTTPMERLYRGGLGPDGSLTRVTISRGFIGRIRRSLLTHGFTEGSLFPDLEGLGRDLRRSLGFDI